ncbi:hypothetical protein E6H21_08995 [Candidatus Bathyarchaeota archaeon]|nr:MAG: hypothetical protein E6H21_08995 [Candidatus Bathyarchaeota archaeon]
MDRVWVRGKPSRKVIESGDVHYFYWKVETGLSYLTLSIRGRSQRVPISFVKTNDYEPIKRLNGVHASRFHYRFLTIFKKPVIVDGKPVARFLTKAHVPVFLSDLPKRVHIDFDLEELGFEETWCLPILVQLLKKNCWQEVKPNELNDYSVSNETVPNEAVFDPSKLRLVVEISQ